MRILYFHQHFTTRAGSGGTRSYELARAIIAAGHEVTMVCGLNDRSGLDLPQVTPSCHRGDIDGIEVVAFPIHYSNDANIALRTWLFLRFAWKSCAVVLAGNYDLVFATSTPLTVVVPGLVGRWFHPDKPFVFEVRDLWPELPRALGVKNPWLLGGMAALEWLAYRFAASCIGLSPGIAAGISRKSPAGRWVALIPNGCDLDLFQPQGDATPAIDGLPSADFLAGFTGAHGPANGLDSVLDAAAVLQQRGRTDIQIALIGAGKCKQPLQRRAETERITNVTFLPTLKKTELARALTGFDCGLQVLADVPEFYYGTSPNKFFDYISAGLPVVCNYPGWITDMLNENQAGLAVRPRSPEDFADALCWLADHPKERRAMGQAARRLAERSFDRGDLASRFVQVIEATATGAGGQVR